MKNKNNKNVSLVENMNITDIWDVTEDDLIRVKNQIQRVEDDLDVKHKGQYCDYQIVDDLFPELTDVEKVKIFVYGQWIYQRMYKDLP